MYVLEAGLQQFDSLFRSFLEVRLAPDWSQTQARIESWLNAPVEPQSSTADIAPGGGD